MTNDREDWILCLDEMPPVGRFFLGLTEWGVCVKTLYHPEFRIVAWKPIPKLTDGQVARLRLARGAGMDVTRREVAGGP